MTYQTTMTTTGFGAAVQTVLARAGAFFDAFGKAMIAGSTGQQRLDRVTALQAKTDAELAELNIKREDIVRHVFKDLYAF